jgi:putative ABC transport system substrate-binding protein
LEIVNLEGNLAKGKEFVNGLNGNEYSLIITIGSEAQMVMSGSTSNLPWVFTTVLDPPSANGHPMAGVAIKINIAEQFSRLKKILPDRKRVGVVYTPRFSSKSIEEARQQAANYGLVMNPVAIEDAHEMADALNKLNREQVDMLWMVADRTTIMPDAVRQTIEHCQGQNIPLIALSIYHVKLGALAAFSVDFQDVGMQTAKLAHHVLAQGAHGEIEYPRKIVIYINSRVQKQLGLEDLSAAPEVITIQ